MGSTDPTVTGWSSCIGHPASGRYDGRRLRLTVWPNGIRVGLFPRDPASGLLDDRIAFAARFMPWTPRVGPRDGRAHGETATP